MEKFFDFGLEIDTIENDGLNEKISDAKERANSSTKTNELSRENSAGRS